MKIIQAMKKVKENKEKITDLQAKIAVACANLNFETPVYGDATKQKISEWLQSCQDLSQDNIGLLCSIARTNLATVVPIEVGGKTVTKTIAEWVWRRREYALLDAKAFAVLTDRNLKEGVTQSSTGQAVEVRIQRHYDPNYRDMMLAMYKSEPHLIDSTLEVINAVTDLV